MVHLERLQAAHEAMARMEIAHHVKIVTFGARVTILVAEYLDDATLLMAHGFTIAGIDHVPTRPWNFLSYLDPWLRSEVVIAAAYREYYLDEPRTPSTFSWHSDYEQDCDL